MRIAKRRASITNSSWRMLKIKRLVLSGIKRVVERVCIIQCMNVLPRFFMLGGYPHIRPHLVVEGHLDICASFETAMQPGGSD